MLLAAWQRRLPEIDFLSATMYIYAAFFLTQKRNSSQLNFYSKYIVFVDIAGFFPSVHSDYHHIGINSVYVDGRISNNVSK